MKRFTPKVVSANALLEGDAVWLAADDAWSRDMADAELIDDEARAAIRLQFAKAQVTATTGATFVKVGGLELNEVKATTTYADMRLAFDANVKQVRVSPKESGGDARLSFVDPGASGASGANSANGTNGANGAKPAPSGAKESGG